MDPLNTMDFQEHVMQQFKRLGQEIDHVRAKGESREVIQNDANQRLALLGRDVERLCDLIIERGLLESLNTQVAVLISQETAREKRLSDIEVDIKTAKNTKLATMTSAILAFLIAIVSALFGYLNRKP